MRSTLTAVLKSIVILAVIATVAQAVLENLAMILGRPWQERYLLLLVGFGLDVFFTAEFLTRFYAATLHRRLGRYLLRERGWVSFIASVPVVVLFSGPAVIAAVIGGVPLSGLAGAFGAAAAFRIVALLRVLRLLPVFVGGRDSGVLTTRRHGGLAGSLAVHAIVLIAVGATLWGSFLDPHGVERNAERRYDAVLQYLARHELHISENHGELEQIAGLEPAVLMVRSGERTAYSRFDNTYYRRRFGPVDFGYMEEGSLGVFFDLRQLNATVAQGTVVYLMMVVAVVALIGVVYQGRFARSVVRPLVTVRRGLEDQEYSREVEIPNRYASEEPFRVARAYNETVLPLKRGERP